MQPINEDHIKEAIEKWEESPAHIGFNKTAMLNKLQLEDAQNGKIWQRIAAAVIIVLLSSLAMYSFNSSKTVKHQNLALQQEQLKQQKQIAHLRDSIARLSNNPKVEYITIEKEKPVLVAQKQSMENTNYEQIAQLEMENAKLQSSLDQLTLASIGLNDSIRILLANMEEIQNDYQIVVNSLEKKESFKVNLNEELLASSISNTTIKNNKVSKEEKLKFKLGKKAVSTSPIRRSISFR
ncbi:hypothetical protein [Carboxylicivirga sp. N1Y90]|uniref:hypothetical protein n=1 Tax=Carboxylicivirga fragile TaxID=3417571 RepID=UPI003D331D44|nr:hypothetical protein [Marinilabiliaceae bacterium N1Y90]